MAAVFSTLVRGLIGIAASVLLVGVVWTLYVQRESVARATHPLVELVTPRESAQASAAPDAAPAPGTEQPAPAAPSPGAAAPARDGDAATTAAATVATPPGTPGAAGVPVTAPDAHAPPQDARQ